MKTVAIENTFLSDLITELRVGEEIVLTSHAEPVAKLVSLLPASSASLQQRKASLEQLRESGGLRQIIPDPSEWQREIRRDTSLPALD